MRKLKNSELNRLSINNFKKSDKTPLIVVLDNIRSLNNIGSVFRTSDAFLIEKIILCGITAIPPHKDIHKTAVGATDSVDWEYNEKPGGNYPRPGGMARPPGTYPRHHKNCRPPVF